MVSRHGRPILVTGPRRSGTTRVGRVIARHPRVRCVAEPFNPALHPDCPAPHPFHHVTDEDAGRFLAYLHRRFGLRPAGRRGHPHGAAPVPRRVLLEDPTALFSAEWLADTFGMDVILVTHHPAAFVAAVGRGAEPFPLRPLLAQPRLLACYLRPFEAEMRRSAASPGDALGHAILAWRVCHHVILECCRRRLDWTFVRHEDLSRRPAEELPALVRWLGLELTPHVRGAVEQPASGEDAGGLEPEEVARVRRETESLARLFYPEPDWWPAPEARRQYA